MLLFIMLSNAEDKVYNSITIILTIVNLYFILNKNERGDFIQDE